MNILVTGVNGYIGAVLANKLIAKGHTVTGLDTYFYKDDAFGSYEEAFPSIQKDVRDIETLDLAPYDAIIHLAALSNDPLGEIDQSLTEKINHEATVALAKKAKQQGVKRFLFSSSCSIYGIAENGIVDENSPVNPLTAYAKSKIDSENALKELADDNFCVGLLRNSTVYGFSPKLRIDLVINNLTACAVATKQIRIMSDGTPWRPLIDVRDLSNIFTEFLTVDAQKINGKVINIGFTENNFQVKDIVYEIQKQLPDCDVVFTGEHADSRSYQVNFDLFKSIFPTITQEWTMQKSIANLIEKYTSINYSIEDFNEKKYTRLVTLKKLLSEHKVDSSLHWL